MAEFDTFLIVMLTIILLLVGFILGSIAMKSHLSANPDQLSDLEEVYETTEFKVQKLARLFVPKDGELTYLCEEGVRIDDLENVIWFENLGYPEEESKTCMIRTKRGLVKEMKVQNG